MKKLFATLALIMMVGSLMACPYSDGKSKSMTGIDDGGTKTMSEYDKKG